MSERVLFISPHPDDVEFGAGMTILSRMDQGDHVKSLVVCLGNNPKEYPIREEELGHVRDGYDYEVELLAADPPTELHPLITRMEEQIEAFAPDVVYLPYGKDRHQDHTLVSEAATIAARTIANKYYYCTPSTKDFSPNHYFVGNRELLEGKISLLACFYSQREKAYLSPNEIRAYAQTSGRNALLYSNEVHYAEPFLSQTLSFSQQRALKKPAQKPIRFDETFFPRSIERLAELLQPLIDPNRLQQATLPWEVIECIPELAITNNLPPDLRTSPSLSIEGDIFVEEGVKLPKIGVIKGPIHIGRDTEIQDYCVLVGPMYIGNNVRVGYYSSIKGSILAPDVRIGQQIDMTRSIILDNTMISHANTIGDSFIGRDCWLPGKTNIANLRADRIPVRATIGDKTYQTNGKYGATIEDGVKLPTLVGMMPGSYVAKGLRVKLRDIISGNRVHR